MSRRLYCSGCGNRRSACTCPVPPMPDPSGVYSFLAELPAFKEWVDANPPAPPDGEPLKPVPGHPQPLHPKPDERFCSNPDHPSGRHEIGVSCTQFERRGTPGPFDEECDGHCLPACAKCQAPRERTCPRDGVKFLDDGNTWCPGCDNMVNGPRVGALRKWYQDNLRAGRRQDDPTGKPDWL